MLQRLADAGLVKGKTVGIDATTLEANAALRSIVRRDTAESYQDFLTKLAQASGIETPTRADLARIDRKRKKKGSNGDWTHPHDPDAKITKMKDGRTHLAHKAEHAVDLETGAIIAVTVQGADEGDTATSVETLIEAAEQIETVVPEGDGIKEVVADKGYHSNQELSLSKLSACAATSWNPIAGGVVEGPSRSARRRLPKSAPHSRRAGETTPAPTWRAAGTAVCASLRNGRHAARALARSHEYPQTRPVAHRGPESRTLDANAVWDGHAAQPPGACGCPSGLLVVPLSTSGDALGRDLEHASTVDVTQRLTRPSRESSVAINRRTPFRHGLLGRASQRARS